MKDFLTVTDVARSAGVDRTHVERYMRTGIIPRPTHQPDGAWRRYYTEDECNKAVGKVKEYRGLLEKLRAMRGKKK